jgi:amidohydrolase
MTDYFKEAEAIENELISNRRRIHENAELGFDLPKTIETVKQALRSYGYEPQELGGGITCTCGRRGKTLLLRADMDALPQNEESGLPFACRDGACHSCGHDAHTAMLLGAAKLLREHESELGGTVKFMFQPAEELLKGSQSMIDAGILRDPDVDAAMGLHMNFGPCGPHDLRVGTMGYGEKEMMASADEFRITVKGKPSHGSTPEGGVNAVSIAAAIITAAQQMMTLEFSCDDPTVLAFCKLNAGTAANIIPEDAEIMGNIRAFSRGNREHVKKRLGEITESVARTWRGTAELEFTVGTDPNVNDEEMAAEMSLYAEDVMERVVAIKPVRGSEDFANLGKHVPSFFAVICAGGPEQGYEHAMHDPQMTWDEKALKYGTAAFCRCAEGWLANHQE